ncbi:hypothetical protein IU488_03530 [Nocardia farcinica]|nr:hypothetical protein [Nocardia farcinica]MBF6068066.1 hypothetical protein [Nocardia farcinica]
MPASLGGVRWWKAIGLAGAAGVVATGVLLVRGERRRRAYTPDQVREQLHVRYAQVVAAESAETTPAAAVPGPRAWVGRRMARGRRLAERIAKRRGK